MNNTQSYLILVLGVLFACIDLSLSIWLTALAIKGVYVALTIFGAIILLSKCVISFVVFSCLSKNISLIEQHLNEIKK